MKTGVLAVVALAVSATAVVAASSGSIAIKDRRVHMKANGIAAGVIGAMLEGKSKFDVTKAARAARQIAHAGREFSKDFDWHFSANSKTGDTKAANAIWVDTEDFKSRAAALERDALAAVDAAAKGEADFKTAAGKMLGNCNECHDRYRLNPPKQ